MIPAKHDAGRAYAADPRTRLRRILALLGLTMLPAVVRAQNVPADSAARPDSAADVMPRIRPRSCRMPRVPLDRVGTGALDRVVLEFTVDTVGRPDSTGYTVVEATHDALVPVALRAAMSCRFDPARSHGRAVASRVRMPFTLWMPQPGGPLVPQ